MTSKALPIVRIRSANRCDSISLRNCRLMVNVRPARVTSASPSVSISVRLSLSRCATWDGSLGAPIVTTALTSGMSAATASTAAPPRLWPTSNCGAWSCSRRASAARRKSDTLLEKLVLANSPSLWPSPVKSKRNTAMPLAARAREMREAAAMSLEQVKQWAKRATAAMGPSGRSRRPASRSPASF